MVLKDSYSSSAQAWSGGAVSRGMETEVGITTPRIKSISLWHKCREVHLSTTRTRVSYADILEEAMTL